ncbi:MULTISPECIES: DUF3081 domain-containing protein [Gammaproteobacteria]|uniref:DUF3081 domain-containing protein n=1 Tax=Gammaproteobacteria TaxID=1236 RepID=UPI000DCF87AD|nr:MULTISPECIES: DUF3081 domain-containing protein [Gammaproteobacteria]RTE85890.1 DUF3081 domain-containing protein [Aliidiomarina sp. B3213]TCZ90109.1 DUF3081 domain-containing protein [Lysobacter sp. N42]
MKNELSTRFILQVFEKIREHGENKDDKHVLEDITAYTDYDGYTVYMEGHQVKLNTGFHNTYHLDYDSERAFQNFLKKLQYIDKNYG